MEGGRTEHPRVEFDVALLHFDDEDVQAVFGHVEGRVDGGDDVAADLNVGGMDGAFPVAGKSDGDDVEVGDGGHLLPLLQSDFELSEGE